MDENKSEFCVNSLIAKVLKDYVEAPDNSVLREELEEKKSGFVVLRQRLIPNDDGTQNNHTRRCKILFANTDSVIIQYVELTVAHTRFVVKNIPYETWPQWFVEFIMPGHDDFFIANDHWESGMRMYGANV